MTLSIQINLFLFTTHCKEISDSSSVYFFPTNDKAYAKQILCHTKPKMIKGTQSFMKSGGRAEIPEVGKLMHP